MLGGDVNTFYSPLVSLFGHDGMIWMSHGTIISLSQLLFLSGFVKIRHSYKLIGFGYLLTGKNN